jgi:hypothetical protein
MKRLRKKFKSNKNNPIRFYMCGEYGEERLRPHFHACLFNCWFNDQVYFKKSVKGSKIYTSETLSKLWPHGYSTTTPLTYETAAYAARYVMKKINGRHSKKDYELIDPETGEVSYREKEFCHMSLKPGIGSTWYDKYKTEVFPSDKVVVKGLAISPPKYYTRKLKEHNPELYEQVQYKRELRAIGQAVDKTDERLMVREKFLRSKLKAQERRTLK